MSSSISAGNSAKIASEQKDKKCKDGKDHDWEKRGSWPSVWEECKKCKEAIFWK